MSNSPINFLGMALGAAAAIRGGKRNKGRRAKMKKRVGKLENQVQGLLSSQNAGPTAVETPIDIAPTTQMGTVPEAFDGAQEEQLQLNSVSPEQTIASPFQPGSQQAGQGMFGNPMQGSFDRSMDEEETY